MSFTHLHVHTEYSLLDGAARIKDVISEAKSLGMDSLAITDHGVMFGVVDFYKEAKKQGIKPVIGCEVYTAARRMADKDPVFDKYHGHLILLAENDEGYHNLTKIVSTGFKEGFYYKPRIDYDVLRKYNGGLIALSGCLAGRVQQALMRKDYEKARTEALELRTIFGENNFFLEIQDQGIEEEAEIRNDLLRLSSETGIPLVATNDVHYTKQSDAEAHDVLLCIQTASFVDEPDRMRFENDQFYLKSEDEMIRLFADIPDAVERAHEIAMRCNVEFEFHNLHLPEFTPPEGYDNKEYLRKLCEDGFHARYGEKAEELRDRLEYELDTIASMGYIEYFLIVWDFINYARSNGIMVGPGRGSAAGSIVAYSLGITDIDPIKYGLIFERFLNPERVSMPDIDIDFCYERRGEVIDYVVEKYGEDKVAQIITFGTMKAKAGIRDVGRVLRMSYSEVDNIAKMIPMELNMTIDKALEVNPELRTLYESNMEVRKLIDLAKALEGMPRHASTHAAGVVISKKSLDEYVPLYNSEKGLSTQFTMTTIEELGLLKMDFLGLRNLTVIRDALSMIEREHGAKIDFKTMEFDDSSVYEMIAAGNTQGVFQLESPGMTQFMKSLSPDCFEDIIAGISLYRPGPMDSIPRYINGKKDQASIKYVTPELEPILSVTYGCLVYQEQVMQIVRDLAGYSYGRSDLVRRAMSKKKADVMAEERRYFIHGKLNEDGSVDVPGCIRNGVSEEAANTIFDDMVKFAEYAFNKSHAAAYAVLAYETGWLKKHYPVEFMAALMTSVISDPPAIAKYIRSCRDMGIEVLPPDVNRSEKKFSVHDGKISFGLLGVKNVGEGIIDAIVKARDERGLPRDLNDFVSRLSGNKHLSKKPLESLIRAGALDSINSNRAQMLAGYEQIVEGAQRDAKLRGEGQMSLFSDFSDMIDDTSSFTKELPRVENFEKPVLLAMEKEVLGVYVSGHPLEDYAGKLADTVTVTGDRLKTSNDEEEAVMASSMAGSEALRDGKNVIAGGMITRVRNQLTKNQQMMAFVEVEDMFGVFEVIVFPRTFEQCSQLLKEDKVVIINGKVSVREGEDGKILANKVTDIDLYESVKLPDTVRLAVPKGYDVKLTLMKISVILRRYPGNVPVIVTIDETGKKVKTDRELWVAPCDKMYEELYEVIGRGGGRRY